MTFAIFFDSVGFGEWFVLLAVILIVVGPKRLPSTARKFGQYYSKFRRAADSFKRQLMEMDTEINTAIEQATDEVKKAADSVGQEIAEVGFEASGGESPSPDEYGGYRGYDEYALESESEPAPAPEPQPESPKAAFPDEAKPAFKITVSPASEGKAVHPTEKQ